VVKHYFFLVQSESCDVMVNVSRYRPWGSGRLKLLIFSTFGTIKVVRSSPLRIVRLYPQEFSGTHFQRLSRPQGTWFRQ
jgi:hypothetical protein